MPQALSYQKILAIKTQRCINQECPTFQLFSNEVRARYNKLVFLNDKCCFDCFGYHTENDRRRRVADQNGLKYEKQYLIDYSGIKFLNQQNNQAICQNESHNRATYKKKSINFVQYLYHPHVYKTVQCPFERALRNYSNNQIKYRDCTYKYCPFIHKNQIIPSQLKEALRKIGRSQSPLEEDKGKNWDKNKFQEKLLNIMLLRSSKSVEDFVKKESKVFIAKQSQSIRNDSEEALTKVQKTEHNLQKQDHEQIERIKQRIKSRAENHLKIDRQQFDEQQSRKVVEMSKTQLQNLPSQSDPTLSTSFNYFKYGQKLALIQGRTVEFKDYKDITDPVHIPIIMKYITAFLNTEGGKLLIGVDDNSYVFGSKFKQHEYDKLLLSIDRQGKFNMNPPLMPQKYTIKRIPVYHDKKGQERWVIQVTVFPPDAQNKRLFLYNRQCYMRMNASTHKLSASEIIEFINLNPMIQNQNRNSYPQSIEEKKEQNQLQHEQKERISFEAKKECQPVEQRRNLLMKDNIDPKSKRLSSSKSKMRTDETNIKDLHQNLNKKSIEELNSLKKQYEQKLKLLVETCKRKERQSR